MKVALIVRSDRGDRYLPRCLESLAKYADFPFSQRIIVDDRDHQLGLAGAVNAGWSQLDPDTDFALDWEEDFLALEPVDIEGMAAVLSAVPYLAQLVLKRQPAPGTYEEIAGGIIEQRPHAYTQRETLGYEWVEHHEIFSLNPTVIPRWVFSQGWPAGNEAAQTNRFIGKSFGFWGRIEDPPRVEHIGLQRAEGWRL